MHGQFLKDVEGNDLVNSWKWLTMSDLKGPTPEGGTLGISGWG